MFTFALRDLGRNPRRTVVSFVGLVLGIGLFTGVLFFVDASNASITRRALAPLTLDLQRVLTSPFGRPLRLTETVSKPSANRTATVTLKVSNESPDAAHDVVINDEPPLPLVYIPGTTTRDSLPILDVAGQIPLAQGLARSGLNLGTLNAHQRVTLTFQVRTEPSQSSLDLTRLQGRVSSKENVIPTRSNALDAMTLSNLKVAIARLPGVGAVDRLAMTDLAPGALHRPGSSVDQRVRMFAFDPSFRRHYPGIELRDGTFDSRSAVMSVEAAHTLKVGPGSTVTIDLPDGTASQVRISGVADLSRATVLFASRKARKLDDFLYVPMSIIVPLKMFENVIVPAFASADATPGRVIRNGPLLELDVMIDRSRLRGDPASALSRSKAVAESVSAIAPDQDYLIDNVSNAMAVAQGDARVARRLFEVLAFPSLLVAALLAVFAADVLASAQRRDNALLRLRGADHRTMTQLVAFRTMLLAGTGGVVGVGIGFGAAYLFAGRQAVFDVSGSILATTALGGGGVGVVMTALAMYVPARRSLRRDIAEERHELSLAAVPGWQRFRIDALLVVGGLTFQGIAASVGAFDSAPGSVAAGRSSSLPVPFLVGPLAVCAGLVLLGARTFVGVVSHRKMPASAAFGTPVKGLVLRSVTRRSRTLASGIVGVALVSAFGVGLVTFGASYDRAKSRDAAFANGADLRVTPSAEGQPIDRRLLAATVRVQGVVAVAPVVFSLENSVLIGEFNQDREDLAAIEPTSFEHVATGKASPFSQRAWRNVLHAMAADPTGVLVRTDVAEDLDISVDDHVQVLVARGTNHQALATARVLGRFRDFPGLPQGVDVVANIDRYEALTHNGQADFYLASVSAVGRTRTQAIETAAAEIRSRGTDDDPMHVTSSSSILDKDRTSLTALDVRGLVRLAEVFTFALSLTAMALFVLGLLLQRRKEFAVLRAVGQTGIAVFATVITEATLVAVCGAVVGLASGALASWLLVDVLRPVFVVSPSVAWPPYQLLFVTGQALIGALSLSLIAFVVIARVKPSEALRET